MSPCRVLAGACPDADPEQLLLRVRYGAATAAAGEVATGLPLIAGPDAECWLSDLPVQRQSLGGVTLAGNGQIALGQLQMAETDLQADAAAASEAAFEALLTACAKSGYRHLLRTWIYLGHIHRGAGDAERYRQFCVGRARALHRHLPGPASFPAATVIGRPCDGASLHFLAARQPGAAVENPRQVSAFDYPRDYGPQPPSFVRALRTDWPALLVSGTAAVVGHHSRHPGDAAAQSAETARNLAALLARAGGAWQARRAVVYLRAGVAAGDAAALRLTGDETTVVEGDICRPELLVECEALYSR